MPAKKKPRANKPVFMKCLEPGKIYSWAPAGFPDTVFEFEAFTGMHLLTDAEEMFEMAVNTCVKTVTNIALQLEDENGDIEVKQFEKFLPSEHYPKIKLNDVLDHMIATALFTQIWNVSKLTAVEAGE